MVTKRPRSFFYRRFGQKHVIAHGHIEQIVNGPQLKCMDVVGLSHLSVQMQNNPNGLRSRHKQLRQSREDRQAPPTTLTV